MRTVYVSIAFYRHKPIVLQLSSGIDCLCCLAEHIKVEKGALTVFTQLCFAKSAGSSSIQCYTCGQLRKVSCVCISACVIFHAAKKRSPQSGVTTWSLHLRFVGRSGLSASYLCWLPYACFQREASRSAYLRAVLYNETRIVLCTLRPHCSLVYNYSIQSTSQIRYGLKMEENTWRGSHMHCPWSVNHACHTNVSEQDYY